ncbi:MAG: hypothetical protein JO156_05405 [Solirubrobacterales bacterium]|nr:hypothetical protein [Solirubrobacterales bacterium]
MRAEPAGKRRPAERGRRPRVTARDQELLSFIAEHRLVLASHAQALLGTSAGAAYARLRALISLGLLSAETRFHRQPGCYQITHRGLELIGSELPRPNLDLREYRHDLGVAWLWLAARGEVFGPVRDVVSERRMRSRDGGADDRAGRFGVRLGGLGPRGRPRLHYPDLVMVDAGGRRVALELELTCKTRVRRETILAGYGAAPGIEAVLYLVEKRSVAQAVQVSARRLGVSGRVHVQWVRFGNGGSGAIGDRTLTRERRLGSSAPVPSPEWSRRPLPGREAGVGR